MFNKRGSNSFFLKDSVRDITFPANETIRDDDEAGRLRWRRLARSRFGRDAAATADEVIGRFA